MKYEELYVFLHNNPTKAVVLTTTTADCEYSTIKQAIQSGCRRAALAAGVPYKGVKVEVVSQVGDNIQLRVYLDNSTGLQFTVLSVEDTQKSKQLDIGLNLHE